MTRSQFLNWLLDELIIIDGTPEPDNRQTLELSLARQLRGHISLLRKFTKRENDPDGDDILLEVTRQWSKSFADEMDKPLEYL